MIPFDSERGRRDPQRGGPGRGDGARDFGDPLAGDLEEQDWGGRLRAPGATPLDVLGDPSAHLVEFPEREVARQATRRESRGAWLLAPLMLAAAAAGMLFVLRGPDGIFTIAFAVVLALGLLWILVSALFPAKADRTCPRCARPGLERLDRESTEGLVCRLCAWSDESASSFFLVEDEGPFEDIVLRERKHGRPDSHP